MHQGHFAEQFKRRISSVATALADNSSRNTALSPGAAAGNASLSIIVSPSPSPDPPTQFPNFTSLAGLTKFHAHSVKTRFLESQDNTFRWNCLIRSYTRLGAFQAAVQAYLEMLPAGFAPDRFTLPIVLKVAAQIYTMRSICQFHAVAIRRGIELDEFCESGLISVYAKAGDIDSALKVFDENPNRMMGSWSALIGGLSRCGCAKNAVEMFLRMRREGFMPDDVLMLSVMSGCGRLGSLDLASQLHKCVLQVRSNGKEDLLLMNSLVDTYGKCGRMDLAYRVFSRMTYRNVSSWTSVIVCYAAHGHVKEAIECFSDMTRAGIAPNHVTFLGVLSACVHGGLVEEGTHYFRLMSSFYGIEPRMKHYACMLDLFGRSGMLEEARSMVQNMPMKPNVEIWGCLMGACEKYGNVRMGEWVAEHLIELEPWNEGAYIVLSNIYASGNMWEEVDRLRETMKERKLVKVPGQCH